MPMLASFGDICLIVKAFLTSDIVGQGITLFLVLLSGYLTAVIYNKFRTLFAYRDYNKSFQKYYEKKAHPVQLVIDPRGLVSKSPIGEVYMAGAKRFLTHLNAHGITKEVLNEWKAGETRPVLSALEIADIRSVCERSLAKQQLDIEAYMSRISTSIALAPSLGLFGTVWGVMIAFMNMSSGGSSMISAVAPGISGALLTTVAGLLVAIVSTLCYNILAGMIRRQVVDMENFEDLFMNDIARLHALPDGAPSTLQLNFQSQPTFQPTPAVDLSTPVAMRTPEIPEA